MKFMENLFLSNLRSKLLLVEEIFAYHCITTRLYAMQILIIE